MFRRPSRDLKWTVLAPFNVSLGALAFVETLDRAQKRYHFGPLASGLDMPFAVSVAYVRLDHGGQTSPSSKRKANGLIVRPHLHAKWAKPLSLDFFTERSELDRFSASLAEGLHPFHVEVETKAALSMSVGFELILSARDIEDRPDLAAQLWRDAVMHYRLRALHEAHAQVQPDPPVRHRTELHPQRLDKLAVNF